MHCHYCKTENDTLALVPIEGQEEWACMSCAKKNGLYCEKHDLVHTKFTTADPNKEDGGHACLMCIEDMVRDNADKAEEICDRIYKDIPQNEVEEMTEWATTAMTITGDSDPARPILRAVATYATRMGKTIEEVVKDVEERPTIKHLLPTHYFL